MATSEKAYAESYSYDYLGQNYSGEYYPEIYREKVKRTRGKPEKNKEPLKEAVNPSIRQLRQLIAYAVFIGMLLTGLLVLNAYATNIQCSINELTKENIAIEDDIDILNMKIDSSISIEQIEDYAIKELNMSYPKSSQCIYISEDMKLKDNFAFEIKKKAYE